MRCFLSILFSFFLLSAQAQIVQVRVYTSATPSAISVTPAEQKYNKDWVFMFDADDGNKEGWPLFKIFDKYKYTDGAGKQINYRAEFALNAMNSYNNDKLMEGGYSNNMSITQVIEGVKKGWAISNHGYYHFDSTVVNGGAGWESAGWLPQHDNIIQGTLYWYKKMGELGFATVPRIWTTPSADAGYNADVIDLGYMASTSQGTTDSYPDILSGDPVTIPAIGSGFKVYRRDFSDVWETAYNSSIKSKLTSLMAATSANRKMYRIGSHLNSNALLYIDTALSYLKTNGNDKGWVTSLQEFEEYHEIKRIVEPTKTVSINGKVTTITYDFSGVPDANRWRDMSLLVNVTGATAQKVLVTGVDEYSFNPTTGLINFYSEKRTGFKTPHGAAQRFTNVTLPISADMVVVGGYPITAKSTYLVDNNISNPFWNIGSGEYASDTLNVYIEIPRHWNVKVNKVRFYDANGDAVDNPKTFYGVKKYTGQSVPIATFIGTDYMAWIETAVSDTATWSKFYLQFLNVNSANRTAPAKITLVGDYTNDSTYAAGYVVQNKPTLNAQVGANSYWYHIIDPANPQSKNPNGSYEAAMQMKRLRFYLDIPRHVFPGDSTWFSFQDSVFKWAHDNNIEVNLTLQGMPEFWVKANYPEFINGQRVWPGYTDGNDNLNVLVPAAWGSYWKSPSSFLTFGKYCFQVAARYGENSNIDESLRKSYTTREWWNPSDAPVWGLGYVQYISPYNEIDKTWIGKNKWLNLNGAEIAAMMSACYDGHKGTMGPGVGIKTADPDMVVLSPSWTVAGTDDDILRMARDWTIANRGYRADGVTPDWPWDVVDFHNYSSDAGGQHQQSTGWAHELSKALGEVDTVLTFQGRFANSMPVMMTETGWDTKDSTINGVRRGTVQNVLFLPNKTVFETQADWTTRKTLINWAQGVKGTDIYELFDNDDVNAWLNLYSSTGLYFSHNQAYWSGSNTTKPKPVANHLKQLEALLGNYTVDSLFINPTDSVWKIQASYGDSIKYVVWVGRQSGATVQTTVPVTEGVVYELDYTDETSYATPFTSQGPISFTATERPTIILQGMAADVVVDPPPDPPVDPPAGDKFTFKRGLKLTIKQKQ